MRAIRQAPRPGWQFSGREAPAPAKPAGAPGHRPLGRNPVIPAVLGFAALFLAGYVAGILLCRGSIPAVGQILADYYTDKQNFAAFVSTFAAQFSSVFLSASVVALCGTSALGPALMALFFAGKGTLLGLCAAAVYVQSGNRGLVIYWLLTFLFDMAALLLLLWLSEAACRFSCALLRAVRQGSAIRGVLWIQAKDLAFRYLITLALAAACSVLGAGSAVLFAGVLL